MVYVLLIVAFLADGTARSFAVPQPFPTEDACKTAATQFAQVAQVQGPKDGIAAIGWTCESFSNPLTQRQAAVTRKHAEARL